MARHIGADSHVKLWRGRQPEMRVEADDSMNPAYRNLHSIRHPVQLLDGKVSVLPLDSSELVEH